MSGGGSSPLFGHLRPPPWLGVVTVRPRKARVGSLGRRCMAASTGASMFWALILIAVLLALLLCQVSYLLVETGNNASRVGRSSLERQDRIIEHLTDIERHINRVTR